MKLLIILTISLNLFAKPISSYNFLNKEAKKSSKNYLYNKYENIINGSIAFTLGNIGYFSTKNETLKLSYSFGQTIGIVNVSQGIYDYYRPIQDKELYLLLKRNKKLNKEKVANGIVKVFAEEERAKRLQLLWGSSLLATQYIIDATSSETPEELKDIYTFLTSINIIVMGYSYFYKKKYEDFYFSSKNKHVFIPTIFKNNNSHYAGLIYSSSF